MTHELYKLSNGGFKVKSTKLERVQFFVNIEAAAESLETIGIPSDQIDSALVDMATYGNNYAAFAPENGLFMFSDSVSTLEQV